MELAILLQRERLQLDKSNARARNCADFYDDLSEGLANGN